MSNSKKLKLYAPKEYWNAIDAKTDLSSIINGCGTNDWKGELIPESFLGLSITPACNIHDWMYYYGENNQDKEEADRVFLNNMVRIINNDSDDIFLKIARLAEAKIYHEMVKDFGRAAFWEGKNQNGTFREV
jgi:hypothetical protein